MVRKPYVVHVNEAGEQVYYDARDGEWSTKLYGSVPPGIATVEVVPAGYSRFPGDLPDTAPPKLLREVSGPEGGYWGAEFDESDWIAHVERLRSDGQLAVGEWHGYVVSPGDSFGPHVGPLYVLVTWRRDTNLVAVADKDPESVVRLASRLEVEL